MKTFYRRLISWFTIALLSSTPALRAVQDSETRKAATAKQAAAVLDLSEFELVDPVGESNMRIIAKQSYQAKGKLLEVANRLQASFKKAGCTELEGAMFMDAYGSAIYQKGGFTFSLSLSPGSKPDETLVTINNHGNVDLKNLPVPNGATVQYALPNTVAYVSDLSVAEANEQTKKQLLQQGWQPFGETTVTFFVKQNAVIIQVMASAAPALGDKTMIQFTSEQISADLPVPPYDGILQYSDSTTDMLFDSEKSQTEIIEFFKEALSKDGWQPTTENPIKVSFREHLIFRNPDKEYLELDFQTVDNKTRTRVKYQTAKQFAETESRAQEAIAEAQDRHKQQMERENNPQTVEIKLPARSKVQSSTNTSIELSIDSGTAQTAVAQWLKSYEDDGWKIERTIDGTQVGEISLTKESLNLNVSYVDPGFIPGEITIRIGAGFQLKAKE